MKALHLISGGDTGGAKTAVSLLLSALAEDMAVCVVCFVNGEFYQEVFEKGLWAILYKQAHRYDMSVIGKLKRLIAEHKFDIIHAHGARANFIALALKPFVKLPMVTTMHSDYRQDFTTGLYKRMLFTNLNAFSLRFMDYYIAVSESFKDMLIERGYKGSDIYTVYNVLDFDRPLPELLSRETFLARCGVKSKSGAIIGIIGRHDKVKGHDVFIRAAAEVIKVKPDTVFLMAGEGAETRALKDMAFNLGIDKSIYFLGFVEDIDNVFNAIDINVLSSYSESFPYALLEGAGHRKATVSTAVGGIPDLIKDGETGYLVPSGDYQALAEKIVALIDAPEQRERLGEALYQFVSARFSKNSLKERQIEIYADIIRRWKNAGKSFDCMISGYYGYKNSGDDALLKAIIESLRREKPDISILVLTKNRREVKLTHNCAAISRHNLFQINSYMKRTRLFIYGGGSLIADNNSTRSLMYYALLARWAKHRGLRLMYYANGIGPVTKKANVPRARKALEIADHITLRDPDSLFALMGLGISNTGLKITVSCDPVMTLEPDTEERARQILAKEGINPDARLFFLSVRGWKEADADFAKKIARAAVYASGKYGLTPVLLAMQPVDNTILNEIASLIVKELGAKVAPLRTLSAGGYAAGELMAVIARGAFVIGMRLHALIYAAAAGVPVIGVVYDPKVRSFIQYINQESYVDVINLNEARLEELIDAHMVDNEAARQAVAAEANRLKGMSRGDAKIAVGLME